MAKHAAGTHHRPAAGHRSFALRPATVLLSGAVCAAVVGTTPAVADDRAAVPPTGQFPILPDLLQEPARDSTAPGAIDFGVHPLVPPAFGQAQAVLVQPAADLTASVMTVLGITPAAAVPPIAPPIAEAEAIPLPDSQLRIGNVQVDRPGFLPPDIALQINDAAAAAETGLSDTLDTTGMDPARSDVIADRVIGSAAVGAMVGNTVATPFSSVAAVVGGMVGLVVGIPFMPAGLVYMPMLGAAAAYTLVAGTGTAVGALIGGAVGAIEGSTVPLESGIPAPPAA